MSREGCGSGKGCFFMPFDCDPSKNCTVGLTYVLVDEGGAKFVEFETVARKIPTYQQQYFAVGLSQDDVMVCSNYSGVNLALLYLPPRRRHNPVRPGTGQLQRNFIRTCPVHP
ncbi:MAG: hypothetical protein GY820_04520 [Gammaproteobacteria bacterium]|nr:hypothetical protein [Gammaproteobacteria bacterium]